MRIVFMGTPEFAAVALRSLLKHPPIPLAVVAVVTQPDRPAGRGRRMAISAVKQVADNAGLPVLQPTRMKDPALHQQLQALQADLFVVAAYGRILPQAILDIPRLGCINIHASRLPALRGASPIAHAIWQGDAQAGVCIMGMEQGLDTGPVYLMKSLAIAPKETCGTLTARLADLGAQALCEALPGIQSQTLHATPQDHTRKSYAPLLEKRSGALDWRLDAVLLERQIRAFDPWPGTFAYLKSAAQPELPARRIGILAADVTDAHAAVPGTVLEVDKNGVVVACGTQALRLRQVKPEGKGAMSAAAWVVGRSITRGDIFEVSLETKSDAPSALPV